MNIVEKVQYARRHREYIPHYLESNLRMAGRHVRTGRLDYLLAAVCSGITGINPLVSYYRRQSADGLVYLDDIYGNVMCVSLADRGLSRDLLMYRTREERSTEIFREELRRIGARLEPATVLELGANIGYYALQEADLLGPDARIFAFEPEPTNYALLEKNVRLNGYTDQFITENKAAGTSRGKAELLVAPVSNQHRISESGNERTTTVDIVSISEYLAEWGVSPSDIDVVRMDVQGYEGKILQDLRSVLTADGPLLAFVEFHQGLDATELDELIPILDTHFEIISALSSRGAQSWYEYPVDLHDFDDLRSLSRSVEVIMLRRDRSEER